MVMARATRAMATATNGAMMTAARMMVMATKRAKAARVMATVTKRAMATAVRGMAMATKMREQMRQEV